MSPAQYQQITSANQLIIAVLYRTKAAHLASRQCAILKDFPSILLGRLLITSLTIIRLKAI